MEITDQKSRVEELADHVMEYVDTRWDLLVLNISEKGLAALSGIATILVLLVFGSIALVFAGIATAVWLGQRMNDPIAGFLIIAGFFVVLLLVVMIFARNYIRTVVTNSLLESIKDDDNEKNS